MYYRQYKEVQNSWGLATVILWCSLVIWHFVPLETVSCLILNTLKNLSMYAFTYVHATKSVELVDKMSDY